MPISGHFNVMGSKFQIWFVENEGMAYGMKLGGANGKIMLSLFRIILVSGIFWYLIRISVQKIGYFMITCISLILAGALGNIIDSVFYGMWFSESTQENIAYWAHGQNHYAGILHGKVVDMLYFHLFDGVFPKWIPFWGGDAFSFFDPVFNIADASISVGIFLLIIFQYYPIFKKPADNLQTSNE